MTVAENSSVELKLNELMSFANDHQLYEVSLEEEGIRISFKRSSLETQVLTAPEPLEEPIETERMEIIKSPIVGIFRRSEGKNRPPLVMEGNHVKPGDHVAIIECMKIPTEVSSFCDGEIREILVEDGKPVEYGQPLFKVVLSVDIRGS
ncbi:MAG: acetyl-CoA carboxylase biotin carboxyl carrier protein [Elusimicrobiota bacterium]